MTDSGRRFHRIGEIFSFETKGHVDQVINTWDLQQRADDGGKRLAEIEPEYGHGNSGGRFEVA